MTHFRNGMPLRMSLTARAVQIVPSVFFLLEYYYALFRIGTRMLQYVNINANLHSSFRVSYPNRKFRSNMEHTTETLTDNNDMCKKREKTIEILNSTVLENLWNLIAVIRMLLSLFRQIKLKLSMRCALKIIALYDIERLKKKRKN